MEDLALVEAKPQSTTHLNQAESEFIGFCQEVARTGTTKVPYWAKNLDRFERVFLKFRDNKNCQIPVKRFLISHRESLEKPVLEGDTVNDHWLKIDSDEPVPEPKSWAPVKPRGVFLPTDGDDDWSHCIPLAEVYSACHDISTAEMKTFSGDIRRNFSGVTIDTVPVKFLFLLFRMLLEVEPENTHFSKNADFCEELMTPATGLMSGVGDMMSSMMSGDSPASKMMAQLTESFTPEASQKAMDGLGQFAQNQDFGALMSSFAPMLQSPAMQNLMSAFTGMMPKQPQVQDSSDQGNISDQD